MWQSFDYPCDTFLPEMKISWDLGLDRYITSWKGMDNPAQGEFSGGTDRRGLAQIVVAMKRKHNKDQRRVLEWPLFYGMAMIKTKSVVQV